MIKFLLGLIAIILAGLGVYTYINQTSKVTKKTDVELIEKEISKKVNIHNSKELFPSKVKKQDKASHKTNLDTVMNKKKSVIGKGLTREDIENSDASEAEKKRMQDDMVYFQSLHMKVEPSLSDEEIQKLIESDLQNGLI